MQHENKIKRVSFYPGLHETFFAGDQNFTMLKHFRETYLLLAYQKARLC